MTWTPRNSPSKLGNPLFQSNQSLANSDSCIGNKSFWVPDIPPILIITGFLVGRSSFLPTKNNRLIKTSTKIPVWGMKPIIFFLVGLSPFFPMSLHCLISPQQRRVEWRAVQPCDCLRPKSRQRRGLMVLMMGPQARRSVED